MVILALTYKKLVDRDFRVLYAVEREMPRYEYVPVEVIERVSGLPSSHVKLSLDKLNKLKLLQRRLGAYIGYRLTWMGFDILALKSLVDRGIIEALGDKLGVGKESDVYSALAPGGKRVIIKFHKIGRTSFQHVVKFRPYAAERPWASWMFVAKLSAEREYRALEELFKVGARVPKPIARSRHAVVIDYVEGVELYEYREAQDPEGMLEKILDTVKKAYLEVGIVHGDLSEYNILVTLTEEGEEEPLIIDWPQYVEKDHPMAEHLLRRDVEYVVRFFRRRFRVTLDIEKAIKFVKGEVETLW
ncbi:Non-specific serine/threonine protein kinase [Pyrolobus fumarii 1A]|uniref:non-specific serine/threonine protein kinase n=1 Tax=Pyrolobus fumarii (strain DSM 11204 / 1A) TaxID=694429 RepID=G0EDI3_PYRF1|nr:RIO1 family regulatory kinase/ATPase [Pyrolobus fumarii]AEM38668.1 Non-specific serine/threonine protein kinase [Pyrolobus fumarii 1A]